MINWSTEDELAGRVHIHVAFDDMTMNHISQPELIKAIEKAYQVELAKGITELKIRVRNLY